MWSIIKGGKSVSPVILARTDEFPLGDPLDLTPFTEITACFQKDDGTELMITLTGAQIAIVGNPVLGKLVLSLTAAQTTLLQVVAFETLELQFKIGVGDPQPLQIKGAYEVVASKC